MTPPARSRWRSRLVLGAGSALLAIVVAGAWLQSEAGGRVLAGFAARATSSPDMKIEIGAIEHPLSSNPAIHDVAIADPKGVWLRIDHVDIAWSVLALLRGRVELDAINIGAVAVTRAPGPATAPAKPSTGPLIPDLPVALNIGLLTLKRLDLEAPVLGVTASLSLDASGELSAHGAGAALKLAARRLDAPGDIDADLDYAPQAKKARIQLRIAEPAGGLIAGLAHIPNQPPVVIDLNGEGSLDDFTAHFGAKAGDDIGANGDARITRDGAARRVKLDVTGQIARLAPLQLQRLLAGDTRLEATLRIADDGALGPERVVVSTPALRVAADIATVPAGGGFLARLDGDLVTSALDIPAPPDLLGQRIKLAGSIRTTTDGRVGFDDLSITGDHMSTAINGVASSDEFAIDASIDIPDLKRADPRLTGHGQLNARLGGSPQRPSAKVSLALANATALGRAIPELTLSSEANDLLGDMAATADLAGTIDGKPAQGKASLRRKDKEIRIDGLAIAIGRASLKGEVAVGEGNLARGRLALSAPNLDDLSAVALRKLAGRLEAAIILDAVEGGQNVAVDAHGDGLTAPEGSVERLAAKFVARDVLRRPTLEGEASLANVRVGKETISRAHFVATPRGQADALELAVEARGFSITGKGLLTPGERSRFDLSALTAQRAGQRIALARPAAIVFGGGRIELKGVALDVGGGQVQLEGAVGERLDLTASAHAVPLSIASLVDSSLGLEGMLDANAHISGSGSAPQGDWKVHIAKLVASQTRSQGLPPIDILASGRLAGGQTSVDADISIGPSSHIKTTGSAPINGAGALDLAVRGALDAALANASLAANGQTLHGRANLDLRLSGAIAAPQFGGDVQLVDGSFKDPLNGVSLDRIAARLEGRGHELNIASFSGVAKNGGQVSIAGHVTLSPESGLPGAFHVAARNAQLASTETVSSTADVDIDIAGPLTRAPKVTGRVGLLTMDVTVPERLPASLRPLPGTTQIDARGFAKQMLDLQRKQLEQAAKTARTSSLDAGFDLAVAAPNRIFVRGRGIDAEFGGDLRLNGTLQKPNVIGSFDLRRGKLQVASQSIDITSGKLSFLGGLTPELDFVAATTAGDVTAKITVSGPANAPVFAFSSTPELPSDEVLSRLLFAKASGQLSPFQAVQLASALAQFSGAGTGIDAFEKMRKALGVDSLDVEAGGPGGPKVGASRYLTDNISVGVKTGAKPEDSAVNVGIDVTKKVRVQGETSVDGKTSVGVGVEWEY